MPKVHKSCKFPGCSSIYRCKQSIRFHSFPKHPTTLKTWKEIYHLDGSTKVQHLRICSTHFDSSDYNHYFLKKYLNRDAIPRAQVSQVLYLFVGFKEIDDVTRRLKYAASRFIELVDIIHHSVFK